MNMAPHEPEDESKNRPYVLYTFSIFNKVGVRILDRGSFHVFENGELDFSEYDVHKMNKTNIIYLYVY